MKIDFFTWINKPPAFTDLEPLPSSIISSSALDIAGKLLIIESIALHRESQRVKAHILSVEDWATNESKTKINCILRECQNNNYLNLILFVLV